MRSYVFSEAGAFGGEQSVCWSIDLSCVCLSPGFKLKSSGQRAVFVKTIDVHIQSSIG